MEVKTRRQLPFKRLAFKCNSGNKMITSLRQTPVRWSIMCMIYDMCVWSMTTCIVYDLWCICVSSLTLWLYVLCMMYDMCVWSMTVCIVYDLWFGCVWSMTIYIVYDLWCRCVWSMTICIVYDLWCMICVSDLWLDVLCMICDVWYVSDLWLYVYDLWCMICLSDLYVLCMICDVWYVCLIYDHM